MKFTHVMVVFSFFAFLTGPNVDASDYRPVADSDSREIENPQLLFDTEHLTTLESCLLESIRLQSPDGLKQMLASAALACATDDQGHLVKFIVTMLLGAFKNDGGHVCTE